MTLLGQGVGPGDPQRSLPTPTMLGFGDSVITEDLKTTLAKSESFAMAFRRPEGCPDNSLRNC